MSIGRRLAPKMTTLELRTRLHAATGDRYRIERTLGEGDVATAYLAHDLIAHRAVVMHVITSTAAAAVGADRFLRELRLAATLRHSNILSLLEAGDADGTLFYVMPGIESRSLREDLQAYGQLPTETAVYVASEVAAALDYAHRSGVVHLDIRPENILVENGRVLVMGFGLGSALASMVGRSTASMSAEALAYMSPEQTVGEDVDGRSDLYSLACVLYEMLVGEPPFIAPTAQAVVAKRFVQTPESVAAVRESIPRPVARALQRALARTPADRHATVIEFANALLDQGEPASAPTHSAASTSPIEGSIASTLP